MCQRSMFVFSGHFEAAGHSEMGFDFVGRVNRNVIPKEKKVSTGIAKFLEENAKNPNLFDEEIQFDKET